MKKLNKNAGIKALCAFLMLMIFSYFISAVLRTIVEFTNLSENVFDYNGTYEFMKETDLEMQLALICFGVLFGWFMLARMNFFKKKYEDASEFGVHGNSRFGTYDEYIESGVISENNKVHPKNVLKTLQVEDGIILGKKPDSNKLIIIPEDTSLDNTNVCLIGSSGSGKGQAFVYNNIVNNRSKTMIVTDPKGELFHGTHQLKRDQGYEVFQIDFLNLDQARYNPLDYVYKDADAVKIAKTISKNSAKDGKEDFFFTTARDLLVGLIIYCKDKNKHASIPVDVKREFYAISDDEEYLQRVCSQIGFDHPAYAYLKDASVLDGKTRTSVLSSFAQQTGIFSLKDVANMTTVSDFNFHEFQKGKSILYVKVPMKENPVEALTATFFDQLITVLYDIADQHHGVLPRKTMFLLDEFANLGKINDYEGTLSTCRGLGISMITIIQDFAQLETKYGKEIARTIINNHDTSLFLRTKDVETAKYFSNLSGATTLRMKTNSTSQSGGSLFSSRSSGSSSQQEQYVKRNLLTEGDLINIPSEVCYVFMSKQMPIRLEKAYQYEIFKDFLFNSKRQPNYISYRESYMKMLGEEITPLYERKPIEEAIKEVAVTKEVEPVEIKEEPKIEINHEKNEPVTKNHSEERLNSLISNFLKKESKESEEETNEEIIEPTIEETRSEEQEFLNEIIQGQSQENDIAPLDELSMLVQGFNKQPYEEAQENLEEMQKGIEVLEVIESMPMDEFFEAIESIEGGDSIDEVKEDSKKDEEDELFPM